MAPWCHTTRRIFGHDCHPGSTWWAGQGPRGHPSASWDPCIQRRIAPFTCSAVEVLVQDDTNPVSAGGCVLGIATHPLQDCNWQAMRTICTSVLSLQSDANQQYTVIKDSSGGPGLTVMQVCIPGRREPAVVVGGLPQRTWPHNSACDLSLVPHRA